MCSYTFLLRCKPNAPPVVCLIQVQSLDAESRHLAGKLDESTSRVEQLEELVRKFQHTERALRAQLQKQEYNETSLSSQVCNPESPPHFFLLAPLSDGILHLVFKYL